MHSGVKQICNWLMLSSTCVTLSQGSHCRRKGTQIQKEGKVGVWEGGLELEVLVILLKWYVCGESEHMCKSVSE